MEYTVTIPVDEYESLIATETRFKILVNAIQESAFVTELYDHLKDEPLISVAKMVDPKIQISFDALRANFMKEKKDKEENG